MIGHMLETPSRIEPARLEETMPPATVDLAGQLMVDAKELGRPLHPAARRELADMVRVLNSYYSNLIEGHKTRPRDIERALADDLLAVEPERRALAREAGIHVTLQAWIDEQASNGALATPTSVPFIRALHERFYEAMPDEFRTLRLSATAPEDMERVVDIIPGAFRMEEGEDVTVGDHHPPSSRWVADFMAHFERRYGEPKQTISYILAIPAAHHRFNYIHPFVDGNGRVSRLMSHAMAHAAGIGADGLWSISRGLSRGLAGRADYKRMMARADAPRQRDRDGRGNLSEQALIAFTDWFLTVCIDQVRFVSGLFDLKTLEARIARLAAMMDLDPRGMAIVAAVLRHGEMQRGDARIVTGAPERTARRILTQYVQSGLLLSEGQKTPVRLAFPRDHHEALFPSLFADGY